jgi:hypothetical protein
VKTNPKQEAYNSAGLLQSDQRSTTASSEEDRLAAGIYDWSANLETLRGAAEGDPVCWFSWRDTDTVQHVIYLLLLCSGTQAL